MMATFFTVWLTLILLLLPSNTLGFSAVTPSPRIFIKDTKVAVEGKSTASVVPSLPSSEDDVTLSNYMHLPVEQYVLIEMPLGSSLTKLDNNTTATVVADATACSSNDEGEAFELVVPEITFFNLTLQPVVLCTVQPMEDKVVIFSNNCYLRGSSFIEKTRLNERFDFRVSCTLTWYDDDQLLADNVQRSSDDESNNDENGVRKNNFMLSNREDRSLEEDNDHDYSSAITATTSIGVDVDVPRPFSSIPKFLLQRTANAAMRLTLNYIQANFVRNLAKDYEKWSTDEEYRSYRALLSSKEQAKEVVMEG